MACRSAASGAACDNGKSASPFRCLGRANPRLSPNLGPCTLPPRAVGVADKRSRRQPSSSFGGPAMRRRKSYNPKRRIRESSDPAELERLAVTVRYGGNPEHKRNPGDFGLIPPTLPRADKTLCDGVSVFSRAKAEELLRKGIRRGLVSAQTRGGFPQHVWSVTDDGCPLEAELDNQETGSYHGYPMPDSDPFRIAVLDHWKRP